MNKLSFVLTSFLAVACVLPQAATTLQEHPDKSKTVGIPTYNLQLTVPYSVRTEKQDAFDTMRLEWLVSGTGSEITYLYLEKQPEFSDIENAKKLLNGSLLGFETVEEIDAPNGKALTYSYIDSKFGRSMGYYQLIALPTGTIGCRLKWGNTLRYQQVARACQSLEAWTPPAN